MWDNSRRYNSGVGFRVGLVVAVVLTAACQVRDVEYEGYTCDSDGDCVDGWVCHPVRRECVAAAPAGDTSSGDTNTSSGDTNTGSGDTNSGSGDTGSSSGDTNAGDTRTGDSFMGDSLQGDQYTGDTRTGDVFQGDPLFPGGDSGGATPITFIGYDRENITNETSRTVDAPGDFQVGDLAVAFLSVSNSPTVTPPSGFVEEEMVTSGDNYDDRIYIKVADAGDVTSGVFPFTFSPSVGTGLLAVAVYRGTSTTQPVGESVSSTGNSTSTITWPAINVGVNDARVAMVSAANCSITLPGTVTQRYSAPYNVAFGDIEVDAGTLGPLMGSQSCTSHFTTLAIVLRP